MSCRTWSGIFLVRCYETECHAIAEWYYENGCHAGLDPASLSKELLEKDTGSRPGVTVRLIMLISFIKTISYEAQCHAIAEWYYENGCHAGLDPASFPEKIIRERHRVNPESSSGQAPVRQNLRDRKVFIVCPGLAFRKWVFFSFIMTMLLRSSMSCRAWPGISLKKNYQRKTPSPWIKFRAGRPGVTVRLVMLTSFIKTMSFRSSMSCRTWSGISLKKNYQRKTPGQARCDSTFGNVHFICA